MCTVAAIGLKEVFMIINLKSAAVALALSFVFVATVAPAQVALTPQLEANCVLHFRWCKGGVKSRGGSGYMASRRHHCH